MAEIEQLQADLRELKVLVRELVEITQTQAKELERHVVQAEQQTDLRESTRELPVVISQLSALHHRAKQLVEREGGA